MGEDSVRIAFREAAEHFADVVSRIPDDAWDSSGLGVWTLRELVGHTRRALTTVEAYAQTPAQEINVSSAAEYFTTIASFAAPEDIAERGRQAGQELGNDPIASVTNSVAHILQVLDGLPNSAILGIAIGGISLPEYLQTRIFELVIHTQDISRASGIEAVPPKLPTSITLHLLADLALLKGHGAETAASLTGRHQLEHGFSLLG